MSFSISSATGHTALKNALRDYLVNAGTAFGLTYSGTGNGTLTAYRGGSASVAETFTIAATSATNFTVTGSVSGSQAAATVGTPYSTTLIAFTLTAGGTAFVSGDTFILTTAPKWQNMLDVSPELILRAPGNDNDSDIFVGIKTFENAGADTYNWELAGMDAYNAFVSFSLQANIHRQLYVPLWQNAMPYWIVANGRRAIMVVKVSTVYVALYLGFLEPGLSPDVYPYPLAIGGTMAFDTDPTASSVNWRWSNTALRNSVFPMSDPTTTTGIGARDFQARVRRNDGTWEGCMARVNGAFSISSFNSHPNIHPYSGGMTALRDGPGGAYPLLPVEIFDHTPNRWGAFEGVYATSGFGIGAETTIIVGLHTHVAFPNVHRAGNNQFFAVKLD